MIDTNTVMTTKDVAEYIKLNEKTVLKMAQEGKLPGVKVSNKWRFRLSAIDDYLQHSIVKMPDNNVHAGIKADDHVIPLSRLTDDALIELDLKSQNKEDVLNEFATIARDAGIISSHEEFAELLRKRETMLSTALGQGVAIPHPRDPRIGMFGKPNIIIARSTAGIQFGAPDDQKTHLFFVICATNECVHLRLLAKVSELLHVPDMKQRLLKVRNKKELIRLLLEFERGQIIPFERGSIK